MKTKKLQPANFDDKDIIVDNSLWAAILDESSQVVSHCESYNSYKSLFFLLGMGKAYSATIIAPWQNAIHVTALQDDGTLFYPDINKLINIFEDEQFASDNNLIILHHLKQQPSGEIKEIIFTYYHKPNDNDTQD